MITTEKASSNTLLPINHPHNQHTFIEISASAINNNITYYKNQIGPHNTLALVIKGNGYGHGLVPMGLIGTSPCP